MKHDWYFYQYLKGIGQSRLAFQQILIPQLLTYFILENDWNIEKAELGLLNVSSTETEN